MGKRAITKKIRSAELKLIIHWLFLSTISYDPYSLNIKLYYISIHLLWTCWLIIILLNSFLQTPIAPSIFLSYFFILSFSCLSKNIFSISTLCFAYTRNPMLLGTMCEPATSKPCTILAHLNLFFLQRY